MKTKNYLLIIVCLFTTVGVKSQSGFQSNSYGLYYNGGNVGIGTSVAEQRLTIKGGNIEVTGALAGLNQPSHTYINIQNKGIRGGLHGWKIFTASSAGGWGIGSNAFEIWEYPELTNSSATSGLDLRRLVIQTNRDQNGCYPIVIGQRGNLNIGYNTGVQASSVNDLSVNGNVGIGTTDTKGYKLAVNGTIRAKEIKVESGWADFVFKKGYQLPTLGEVEQHIQEKGHLPNIPSEAEVKANGVGLGEMNTLLLQKIEELTLYVIGLQKENDEMKNEIKTLKSIINN